MAIQISGTTVVNDSRQLQNISGLDATSKGNMPFVGTPTITTNNYSATSTNQYIDNLESITTDTSFQRMSKTTSTSMTKVVLDTTLPTFSNLSQLEFTSTGTATNVTATGGYIGMYYRVWIEVDSNYIWPVITRGSFASTVGVAEAAFESEITKLITVDSSVSTPSGSSTELSSLPVDSGGKLLVEVYNYPQTSVSGYGYFTFSNLSLTIKVLNDIDQTFFDLGIL